MRRLQVARSGGGDGPFTGFGVGAFGGGFDGAPPGFVVPVPSDRGGQAGPEVRVAGAPAEFVAECARIDGVTLIVPGAVGDEIEIVRCATELGQQ